MNIEEYFRAKPSMDEQSRAACFGKLAKSFGPVFRSGVSVADAVVILKDIKDEVP